MKIYSAGNPGGTPTTSPNIISSIYLLKGGHLFSYYYVNLDKLWYMESRSNKVELFLDSGAYSAATQKVEIKIEDYISFIKENKQYIHVYANLDVIGNPAATWKNQMIMEKAGLSPIPVFHYGQDIKWLLKIISKKYPYIALGGMVGKSTSVLANWLDTIWNTYLTDDEGYPICKVHGFGMTAFSLMRKYPWYSVDSTSWVLQGRLGGIYIPQYKNNEWDYSLSPWKIQVSNKSPSTKEVGKHFTTLPKKVQELFHKYINDLGYVLGKSEFRKEPQTYVLKENEKWGKKPKDKNALREVEKIITPGICNSYQMRDELNIHFFLEVEKTFPSYPWAISKTIQPTLL